ncbi:MAG: hypothetical protein RR207_05885 [Clostridia bacterium]
MAKWKEPKSDYTAEAQVVPEIFNTLAENEKHLKEITCNIEIKTKANEVSVINNIVLVEV